MAVSQQGDGAASGSWGQPRWRTTRTKCVHLKSGSAVARPSDQSAPSLLEASPTEIGEVSESICCGSKRGAVRPSPELAAAVRNADSDERSGPATATATRESAMATAGARRLAEVLI
jgi:hypothetical protein